jgi:effector-binding domain-containing protein
MGKTLAIALPAIVSLLLGAAQAQVQPLPAPPSITAVPEMPSGAPPEKPAEIVAGEERALPATPVLRLKGKSTWDDGFKTMVSAFTTLKEEAKRTNSPVKGNPRLYFIESDDLTFTYEAYLPLEAAPQSTGFSAGVEPGQSPAGRVVIFPYDGTYDEIDAAYEAIAAWLDDKGLVSTGSFIEEYLAIPARADEQGLRVTIYVFIK